MRRAPIVSACLLAAGGSKETIYITTTENAPPDLTSEPVTTTTADSAPTDTAGTADTADTGTPGPTGDPEVVACVARHAECTSTTDYREGPFATRWVFTYDDCGLLTTGDTYLNGNLSSRWTLTYDAEHFLVEDVWELATGLTWRWVHSYDALGLYVHADYDEHNDGTFDGSLDQAYDSQRRVVMESLTLGGVTEHTAYIHTGDELVGSLATDRRANGTVERIESWDRVPAEPLTWHDTDADGVWDEQVETTLAADGQPLEAVTTRPDGQILRREWWVYDAEGRELENTIDELDDGTPEVQSTTTWVCP